MRFHESDYYHSSDRVYLPLNVMVNSEETMGLSLEILHFKYKNFYALMIICHLFYTFSWNHNAITGLSLTWI